MDKLYVSDLDGTLLNEKAELDPEVVERLNTLIDEKKICFSVATARTHKTVDRIFEKVHLKLPLILMNGVMLFDPQEKRCVMSRTIPKNAYCYIADTLKICGVTGFVYTMENGIMHTYYEKLATKQMQEFYTERVEKYQKLFEKIDDLFVLKDKDVIYLSLLHEKEVLDPVYEKLSGREDLHLSYYKDIYGENLWYLEISEKNATKHDGILALKDYLKAEKIICFGDNLNDLPMFEGADYCLAVKNAKEEVKDKADEVIGSNLEYGVIEFLEKNNLAL